MKTAQENSKFMNTETHAILEGIAAAGFKKDLKSNYLNLQNDLGVSLDDFMSTIGFTSKQIVQNKRTWVEFTKGGLEFKINHRLQSEFKNDVATVDFY